MNSRSKVVWLALILIGWGALQLIVWRMPYIDDRRYLIITTDDAGLCPAVNEATIEALEFGLIKSASIMTVCPGFDEFATFAAAHPEFDYGVHLVLTSENPDFKWGPLLGGSVPSLIRADGTFWRKSEEVAYHARPDDVAIELEAQIRRALDRGIRLTHLDHHMWVLLQRPDLFEVFVKLGIDFQLPLRVHREFVPAECGVALQDVNDYRRIIEPLVDRGDRLIDFIETGNYVVQPDDKHAYFINALRSLPAGVSEFVVHCTLNRPGAMLPSAVERREADFRFFTSPETRNEIQELGVQIIDWKQLAKMRKAAAVSNGNQK